jgi:hypothetical protein
MRRLTFAVLSSAVFVSALAVSSGLAAPGTATSYHGTGHDFFNNGPRWLAVSGHGYAISFQVSKDGTRVLNFRGKYAYYCGHGTSLITAASLKIRHASFGGTGKRSNQSGTNYFALIGHFSHHGRTAQVSYLDDFVFKGKTLMDPYSLAYHAPSLACESRVTGTVSAR